MSLTSVSKVETNRYLLEVSVDAKKFEEAVEKAYRRNIGKMNVPGFRKGKAPRGIVEKIYGKGVFYEDAVNALYPEAYEEALKEANLEPVDRAEVEIVSVDAEGFRFKATVTVKPEVTVKDYKGVSAVKNAVSVTDEEVEAEVKRLQERNARIVDVDDRPAQEGDNTIIDFEGFVDGKAFEGGKGEHQPLTLGSGQFIPGFEEQVVGHSIGDEFDVNVKFPDDYHAEELKGKDATFKVKLHEIKMRELPELDDEFAKDVSEFDTLEELKADLKKKVLEHKEHHAQEDYENQLIEKVIANMEAEIPEVMYEHRVDEMVRDFEYRLQSQGLNLQTYLQYTNMELEAFRKTFREQAEKQVKIRLALEEIAKLEKIEPTAEEIAAEYEKIASGYGMDAEKVKSFVPEEELKKDLAVNKAIDVVRDNAVEEKAAAPKKTARKPRATKAAKAEKAVEEVSAEEKTDK